MVRVPMNNSGQILLEVLIAITIASVVVVLGSQLVYVSLLGNKISGDNDIASGLVEEAFEAARAAALENWDNVFSLAHDNTKYFPQKSTDKWELAIGTENILLNEINYSRSLDLQNVCRGASTKMITGISDNNGSAITCNDNPGSKYDPSTQKINVIVSWPGGNSIIDSDYLTRWPNKTCPQANWSSVGSGVNSCPASVYDSKVNITTGTTLELCSGGC